MDSHRGGTGVSHGFLNHILDVGEVEFTDPNAICTIIRNHLLCNDLIVDTSLQELEGKTGITCTVKSLSQSQVDHRLTIDMHIACGIFLEG